MRSLLAFINKCILGILIATILFVLFFYVQRYNYTEPEQVYLMGTKIGYVFVFVFLFIVTFFIFSFVKHRKDPIRLKKRFFLFSSIYMLLAPLVVLSFDNYLIVTKKGLAYNRFFSLSNEKIHSWKEIEKVTLDYVVHRPPNKKPEVKLHYYITYHNQTRIDINNKNSPLYQDKEFEAIHNVIKKHRVPIQIQKPLPPDLAKLYPFYAKLFKTSIKANQSHQDAN